MRALVLAAGAAVLLTATLPASAAVLTVGGSFAEGCYNFAKQRARTLDAVDTCNRALTDQALSSDDQFATFVNRGLVRMFRSEFDIAEADFNRAIALDPRRGESYLNMAVMRFKQGDSAAAVAMFDKAIELGTDVPEIAYYGRAMAHEEQGDLKAAYADLRQAVTLAPKWAEPRQELARYQVRQR